MTNELFISSTADGERIALVQDKRLVEYHEEEKESRFNVGDIYLGSVNKLNLNLNAAFINIGHEKDGFLHYLDLGPQIKSFQKLLRMATSNHIKAFNPTGFKPESDIDKLGKIQDVLQKSQPILVQITKEPISTKGPRLTGEISLAGRYLVLQPFSNAVSVSKKILAREERQRLVKLVQSIKPKGYGVIIRTVAENRTDEELKRDLENLVIKFQEGISRAFDTDIPGRIIGEVSRANALMRDLLNSSFDTIYTDSKDTYDEVKSYVKQLDPEREKLVKLHSGKTSLFEQFGIEKQLKITTGKTVTLPTGGYLVIEHTEALHVIDVNSGSSINRGSGEDSESTSMRVNLEAAEEVARQLRLRDLGGIIVVDFIDLKKAENRRILFEKVRDAMALDRAKHTVLPLSKFGILQITRQRVRPQLALPGGEVCPTCQGTGTVQSSFNTTQVIEKNLEFLLERQNEKGLTLVVHPYIYAYYVQGFPSKRLRWYFKYRTWVKVVPNSSLGLIEYKFLNASGEEIEVKS